MCACVQHGWALYRVAREQELTLELAVEHSGAGEGLWQPVDKVALAQWQRASLARADAGRAMAPLVLAVKEEHSALEVSTVALAHALAAWCTDEVDLAQTELTRQHCLEERAQALLAIAAKFCRQRCECGSYIV